MIIEVNGTEYKAWTEASATVRLDTLCNSFKFKATSKEGGAIPFRAGERCSVKVDGERIITGNIEIVNVDGDDESHTISLSGRDKTGDVLDSKIGALSDIRPPVSLKHIIESVLAHIGSKVKVVDYYHPRLFIQSEDLASPEFGQSVWDFIESLARKRQVLLSSTAWGNIAITRASGVSIDATIQNKIKDDTNNVIAYSVSYDTTGLFRIYQISGQQNPSTINNAGLISNYSIAEQISAIEDQNVRRGRQFAITAENAGTNLLQRTKWEYNVRKARSQVYSATVHGFRNQTGDLWKINQLVNVVDEYAGIKSRMLVNSVQYSIGEDGRQAVISLVSKNSYTLSVATQSDIDNIGVGIIKPAEEEVIFIEDPTDPESLFGPGR